MLDFILQCILSKNDTKKTDPILFLWVYLFFLFNLASYTLIADKRYQEKEEVTSSVRTSVKGVAHAVSRIWDTAEYAIPMQASLNLMSA